MNTFRIVSPDASGRIDPPVMRILSCLPKGDNGIAVVPVTRLDNFRFRFNPPTTLAEPWVLVDFCEFGWEWDQRSSYLWPHERTDHTWFEGEQWKRLADFIMRHPPAITFQRELLAEDVTERLLPVEYPNWMPEHQLSSKEEFLSRPIQVLMQGGRSHESRMQLFGAIMAGATLFDYDVITHWSQIEKAITENRETKKWASIFTPHFSRIDVLEVDKWNQQAKMSISMPGSGVKCFRHGEAVNGAIMALPYDSLAWSSEPISGVNCLRFHPFRDIDGAIRAVSGLNRMLNYVGLYDIYVRSQELAASYRGRHYVENWLVRNIEKAL